MRMSFLMPSGVILFFRIYSDCILRRRLVSFNAIFMNGNLSPYIITCRQVSCRPSAGLHHAEPTAGPFFISIQMATRDIPEVKATRRRFTQSHNKSSRRRSRTISIRSSVPISERRYFAFTPDRHNTRLIFAILLVSVVTARVRWFYAAPDLLEQISTW